MSGKKQPIILFSLIFLISLIIFMIGAIIFFSRDKKTEGFLILGEYRSNGYFYKTPDKSVAFILSRLQDVSLKNNSQVILTLQTDLSFLKKIENEVLIFDKNGGKSFVLQKLQKDKEFNQGEVTIIDSQQEILNQMLKYKEQNILLFIPIKDNSRLGKYSKYIPCNIAFFLSIENKINSLDKCLSYAEHVGVYDFKNN